MHVRVNKNLPIFQNCSCSLVVTGAVINIYTFYNAKFKTCTTVSMDGKLEMGLNPHQNNQCNQCSQITEQMTLYEQFVFQINKYNVQLS